MSEDYPQASILIVDDDVSFASALQKTLGKVGHEVVLADNFADALRLVTTRCFDLVVTDYRIGSSSGLDMISSIRQRGVPVKILLLTAFEEPGSAEKVGADGCLSKPVRRGEILECVSLLLTHTPGNVESNYQR